MYYFYDEDYEIIAVSNKKKTLEARHDEERIVEYDGVENDIDMSDNTDTEKWQHDPETGEPYFGDI